MTSCELPLIRVNSPGDLIDAVPYLMGFHPSESLVLVGFVALNSARLQRITVTMRIDLPRGGVSRPLLAPLLDAFESSATEAVVAVLLSDTVAGDPRDDRQLMGLADQLRELLGDGGLRVLDVLAATSQRWWSLCCRQADCCPAQGTERRSVGSTVAAEATFAGLVALPDRDSLAATLTGCSDAERAALKPALAAAERRLAGAVQRDSSAQLLRGEAAALLSFARACEDGNRRLSARQLARFAVALTDVGVRDALWLAIDSGELSATAFLHDLHARLPPPYDAAVLFLYGWAQWRAGNGTLAAMAAERALESDPDYSAAVLLISAVSHGLDPRSTPALRESTIQRLRA